MPTPESTRRIPDIAQLRPLFPGLEILEFLGAGGMGAVYLARQTRLDRMIALKVVTCTPEFRSEFALRFEREARVLARLSHPNIVTVHDFGDVTLLETPGESLFFLIMEFVEGEDLARRLQRGALPETESRDIAAQVCDALAYAHGEGVTHRDIKPANLLLDRRGRVKVADFGLAKLTRGADTLAMNLTLTGATMGTPHYMAPEQWEPSGVIDHRADLYALGVVCGEMVSARVKLEGDSNSRRPSRASRRFELIVDRATQRDPARRFSSAGEMRAELANIGGARFELMNPRKDSSLLSPRRVVAGVVLVLLLAVASARFFVAPQGLPTVAESVGSDSFWDPAASRVSAERALALGATVAWEQDGRIGSVPGEALPPGEFKVFKVSFESTDYRRAEVVSTQDLHTILGAREMEQLSLKGCKKALDERTCAMIGDLPRLNDLILHLTNIRDEWVSSVAAANLKSLSLDGTLVSDRGVSALVDLTNLESLRVLGTLVSGQAVAALPFAAQLRHVGIGDRLDSRNWDEDVAAVVEACENLDVLFINGNITPSGFERLARSESLTQICIGEIPLHRAHFTALASVPSLTKLTFDKAVLIPDEAWDEIPRMKELRVIAIRSGPSPPTLISALERCNPRPKLEVTAPGNLN